MSNSRQALGIYQSGYTDKDAVYLQYMLVCDIYYKEKQNLY